MQLLSKYFAKKKKKKKKKKKERKETFYEPQATLEKNHISTIFDNDHPPVSRSRNANPLSLILIEGVHIWHNDTRCITSTM